MSEWGQGCLPDLPFSWSPIQNGTEAVLTDVQDQTKVEKVAFELGLKHRWEKSKLERPSEVKVFGLRYKA